MTVSLELRLAIASHYSEEARKQWLDTFPDEWDTLVHEAVRSRLAPLLYDSLQKFPREDVPEKSYARLRQVYLATGTRNMWMLHKLEQVTDVLDEIGVRYILLKGAALIQDVYGGNIALRPMSDIDILVDSADVWKIRPAVKKVAQFAPTLLEDEDSFSQHEETVYPAKDVAVEMHTRLVRYASYAGRPAFTTLARQERNTLTPEWQLIHLCVHAHLHHEGEIAHFGADAAHVLKNQLNWDVVICEAEKSRMILPLQWGIRHLINEWFVEIPAEVVLRIVEIQAEIAEKFYVYCARHAAFRRVGTLVALPTWQLKMRFIWSTIFPSHEFLLYRWGDNQVQTRSRLYLKRIGAIPKRLFKN